MFPSPPLKFRTAGFPQYGFKRDVECDLRPNRLIRTPSRAYTLWPSTGNASGPLAMALPSRGPWLGSGLCCPAASSLTMASSEPLAASSPTYVSSPGLCSPARSERSPIYSARVCHVVPPSVPRWTERVHPAVASPLASLRHLRKARHPHFPHAGSHAVAFRGCKVRFMLRPAVGSPCTGKDFYFRAFISGVTSRESRL